MFAPSGPGTKQASEPLRYRSRTCFEQAEIIYSACGAAREHQHQRSRTAAPAFFCGDLERGYICNLQTIKHIQNSGIATTPLKQGTCDTLLLHSADNQYIAKHPRSRSPQKLPTSQHNERPVTSPVSAQHSPPDDRDKKSAKIVTKVLKTGISPPKTAGP